jgi:hypothetical protein
MPKRIRLVSATTAAEQRQVLLYVLFLAQRSDQFYAYVRNYLAARIGVTPQWLDWAVGEARRELSCEVISEEPAYHQDQAATKLR